MSPHWDNICNWRHHLVNSNTLSFFEMHLSFVQAKLEIWWGCVMGTITPLHRLPSPCCCNLYTPSSKAAACLVQYWPRRELLLEVST